jgi:Fic family protein
MDHLLQFDDLHWSVLQQQLQQVDAFRDRWELVQAYTPEELRQLRQLATVQSVGSSTRIEGVTLTDEAIARLIESLTITELQSRDQQEVAGYFEALDLILEQYAYIEWTESNIRGLHQQLLRYSSRDEHHRGKYKTLSNQVVANLPDGTQRIIFQTTGPAATPEAMRQLVAWTNQALAAGERHPLIVIGTAIYEFLSIHPFQDGNGRLSRLLTTLLLLKNGYAFVAFTSVEHEIERRKAQYYRSLMKAQRYRGQARERINDWLFFFLDSLNRSTARLEERGRQLREPEGLYLNPRQEQVLRYVRRQGPVAVKDLEAFLPDISRNTLKYDLARLYEAGLLERRGKGRGTVYQ